MKHVYVAMYINILIRFIRVILRKLRYDPNGYPGIRVPEEFDGAVLVIDFAEPGTKIVGYMLPVRLFKNPISAKDNLRITKLVMLNLRYVYPVDGLVSEHSWDANLVINGAAILSGRCENNIFRKMFVRSIPGIEAAQLRDISDRVNKAVQEFLV